MSAMGTGFRRHDARKTSNPTNFRTEKPASPWSGGSAEPHMRRLAQAYVEGEFAVDRQVEDVLGGSDYGISGIGNTLSRPQGELARYIVAPPNTANAGSRPIDIITSGTIDNSGTARVRRPAVLAATISFGKNNPVRGRARLRRLSRDVRTLRAVPHRAGRREALRHEPSLRRWPRITGSR